MSAPPDNSTASDVSKREGEYFDSLIESRGDFNPFAERGWRTMAKRFTEMIDPQSINSPNVNSPGKIDLLDIGCGTGQSLQIYEKHCRSYTGADLSSTAIEHARKKFPHQNWIVADACKLPIADHSLDVVTYSSVLHHIPDPTPALREAARVLRPGGKIFAFDSNLLHPAMALFRWPKSPLYSSQGVSPNERPLLPRELRAWFKDAGLIDIRQRCQADLPYRAVAPKLLNACLSIYNAGDWVMEKTGLGRIFGTFVITIARTPTAA